MNTDGGGMPQWECPEPNSAAPATRLCQNLSKRCLFTAFRLSREFFVIAAFASNAADVLLLDEVSMLDIDAWAAICSILSTIDHSRRPEVESTDVFGSLNVILFGDR